MGSAQVHLGDLKVQEETKGWENVHKVHVEALVAMEVVNDLIMDHEPVYDHN